MADTVVPEHPTAPVLITPAPRSLEVGGPGFTLHRHTPLVCQSGAEEATEMLASRLREGLGWAASADLITLPLAQEVPAPVPGAVSILLDAPQQVGREGYTLTVAPDGVVARATTRLGALNAVRTLLQLLPARVMDPDGAAWGRPHPDDALALLPGLRIEDAPRWAHRGVMIDVARSFLPVEELLRVIEAVSLLKLNVLHLHLVDDQGWRLEITNEGRSEDDPHDYTRLTQVSGRTAVSLPAWSGRPGRPGWYTQEDYRRILAFCRVRGIEVVPEIDVPGHVGAALHALEGLCTPGSSHEASAEAPTAAADASIVVGFSYLDPHAPATRSFLRHVLTQVMDLDPQGRRVHLGGDEPWAMAERYGIGPGSAYAELLSYACQVVRARGRVPIGWNEAWSARPQAGPSGPGEGSAAMQLQVWDVRGEEAARGQELAARQGARFIMSPCHHAYLDMMWDEQAPLGLDWAGVVDIAAARDWDPEALLEAVGREHIEGVEATLWAETARGVEDVETLLLPRLLGTAEVGWCVPLARDPREREREVAGFMRRCAAYGGRLRAVGTAFALVPGVPWREGGPDYGAVVVEQEAERRHRG